MFSQTNDNVVNFSSDEYFSSAENKQTKRIQEELRVALMKAKEQASARGASAELSPDNENSPTTFEDLIRSSPASSTPAFEQSIRMDLNIQEQPSGRLATMVRARALNRPSEGGNSPRLAYVEVDKPPRVSSSPGSGTISAVRHGRRDSSTTVSDVENEHISKSPICNKCHQCRGSVSCFYCDLYFCRRCYQDVHDMNSKGGCGMGKQEECPQHSGKMLEYWCNQDNQAICPDCGLFGIHKGHDISKLDERNKETVQNMELVLPKAKKVLEALVASRNEIQTFPTKEMKKVHNKVATFFQEKRDQLQKKEDTMHLQIEQSQKELTLDCNSKLTDVDAHIMELKNTLKMAHQCLQIKIGRPFVDNNGNHVDVCELLQHLTNLTSLPCIFDIQEAVCDQENLMLNYSKPNLQPLELGDDLSQTYQGVQFEDNYQNINSQIKMEPNHVSQDVILAPEQSNYKDEQMEDLNSEKIKKESAEKDQIMDNTSCSNFVTSRLDQQEVPVSSKKEVHPEEVTSMSKSRNKLVSTSSISNDDLLLLRKNDRDDKIVVLKNVGPEVGEWKVATWAQQWGKVEKVSFPRTNYHQDGKVVVMVFFKTIEAAKSCLNARKWMLNDAEIHVGLYINRYTNSIYCRGLPKNLSELKLSQCMKAFGSVENVKIAQHLTSGDMFAIVDFSSEQERDLALASKNHLINGWRFFVSAYGTGKKNSERRPQVVSSRPELSTKLVTSANIKSPDGSQEKECPLSTSTPLDLSCASEIACEVKRASCYMPEVHRTHSGKFIAANMESESQKINSSNSQLILGKSSDIPKIIHKRNDHDTLQEVSQSVTFPDKNCDFEDKTFLEDIEQYEKELEMTKLASNSHSKAELTADGWTRPVLPKSQSIEVKVTHIDSSGTVWVIPISELRAWRFITKVLSIYCEDLISSPDTMRWRPGQRALVFHQGFHKRAEILKVTRDRLGSTVNVVLVDSGRSIHCRGDQLLIAPRSGVAFSYPSLALPVRLYGVLMNSPLDQTHREAVMDRVRQKKCTLTLAWMPSSFPLPACLRYTASDQDSLEHSGNMAEDFIKLKCGKLVVSFADWSEDIDLSELKWMLDESWITVNTKVAIPSTFPLRAGMWIPCDLVTFDDNARFVCLHPREVEYLDQSKSMSSSILQDSVDAFQERLNQYKKFAETEQLDAHLFPSIGESVLVCSHDEWHRARVIETTDEGPWVQLPDFIFVEQVKREDVRKMPDQYWHLDPVQAIQARWPLTGTETSGEIRSMKQLLEFSTWFFEVAFFDEEKQEVVGYFYDKNKKRIL